MSDLVVGGDGEPLTEGAWLLPLATMPLAVTLVCASTGLSPLEAWQEGGVWLGAIGVAGLLSSLYAARIIASAASANGPPPALAIVPFVVPHLVALLAANDTLSRIFVATTYCGPGTREQVITGSLAETLLFRLAPLFIACAGVLTVTLSTVFVTRDVERRRRWLTIAAVSCLAWSLAVTALSVTFIRRQLLEILEIRFDAQASWLHGVIGHYRDYATASNTLMLAATVFAATALGRSVSRRERLAGAVTMSAVLVGAIGFRGSLLLDEAQLRWQFDEFPILEDVRPFDPTLEVMGIGLDTWRPDGAAAVKEHFGRWSTVQAWWPSQTIVLVKQSQASGVPTPFPIGFSARPDVSALEFRRGLRAIREEGVSDVIFQSPIEPFGRAPGALRPLIEFQDSFDWSDAISVRFSDEPLCQPTHLLAPPSLAAAWRLGCEPVSIDDVTPQNLHALAASARDRGHRLVVVVPRLQP